VTPEKRQIAIRLIHDGKQPGTPVDEAMRFGLQDARGQVHPGIMQANGALHFHLTLDVKGQAGAGQPVFGGAFAHGSPAGRFLYLSWKREMIIDAMWVWRIKSRSPASAGRTSGTPRRRAHAWRRTSPAGALIPAKR
jgi:hypothetical protein